MRPFKALNMAVAALLIGWQMACAPRPPAVSAVPYQPAIAIPDQPTAPDAPIYADALASGWDNWSWDTTANFNSGAPNPVHGGASAISVIHTAAWGGLYLHTSADLAGADYASLRFWIHGGAGGQRLTVALADAAGEFGPTVAVGPLAANWTEITVPMADLGTPAAISGLVLQDSTGAAQAVFYVDDLTLVGGTGAPPGQAVALSIDAAAGRHPISPDIYGMNFAPDDLAEELNLPVNRWGGNSTSRYNWRTSMSNRGSDWYYENIQDGVVNVAELPNGSASDQFVEQNRGNGSQSIITVPAIGWVAKPDSPRDHPYACAFKVSKYGAQESVDPWDTDCGNGRPSNGTPVTGNDPLDTSQKIDPAFVGDWVAHLVGRYGAANGGGVRYYALDNEPMLWHETHRDIHPDPATYDEVRDAALEFAPAIKAADPGAQILGPAVWGWWAYFCSAHDIVISGGCSAASLDRAAHGGTPLLAWYLQQMKQYEDANGTRILDYLDIHYYPQGEGVSLEGAGNAATQALRLRSTRSLWDPTYTDESWVANVEGGKVNLIPRMKSWIAANYPGTKLAITEYNWGGLEHINGAVAQADVLGIFGREGVDLATLWGLPESDQPGAFAFRMYRNYDGEGSAFGDIGIAAASADQSRLAIYAAQRTDGTITAMVLNKTTAPLTGTLNIAGASLPDQAQVYRYSQANLAAIVREPDISLGGGAISALFPGQSITLLVIPPQQAWNRTYVAMVRR